MKSIIEHYRRYRNYKNIAATFGRGYAFVGIGSHSTQNLYPVIDYLHIPLKYICCTDKRKLPLIERSRCGVKATTRLDDILEDENVRGVFVSASPQSHFDIARRVLRAGKMLFIEKPPCLTRTELAELASMEENVPGAMAMAGVQKRYSPCVQALRRQLRKSPPATYHLTYATGLYPEGNAISDLFIHPVDLICHLFGTPAIKAMKRTSARKGGMTILMLLEHDNVSGTVELSTDYSWKHPVESLSVNTAHGTLLMEQTESLLLHRHPQAMLGIPLEKITGDGDTCTYLYRRDNFSPLIANNQIYAQGFFTEISTFANIVETGKGCNLSPLRSLMGTFEVLEGLAAQEE